MAELKLNIKKAQARELTGVAGQPMTDEIYNSMGYSQQLMVNLYEKFVGELTTVGEFQGNYFVRRENLEELAKVMKLV